MQRSALFPIVSFISIAVLGIGMFSFSRLIAPTVHDGQYRWDTGVTGEFQDALSIPAKGKILTVTVLMDLPRIHAGTFLVRPDDCLNELSVNGMRVNDPKIPFCGTEGKAINLRPYLEPGTNILYAIVKDNGGNSGFRIDQDPRKDPLILGLELVFAALILVLGFFSLK